MGKDAMAVKPVYPFLEQEYLRRTRPFVEWMVPWVDTKVFHDDLVLGGWLSHLMAYDWKGCNWQEGISYRKAMSARLRVTETHNELHQLVEKIRYWGGINAAYPESDVDALQDSLIVLNQISQGNTSAWKSISANRISLESKVYEMYDLESWVIYDSRVATGLARLVSLWWNKVESEPLEGLLMFPTPRSRNGQRLCPGFPLAVTENQKRLGFIYASWLCKEIALRLVSEVRPPSEDSNWHPYHVEMVMFMLGK